MLEALRVRLGRTAARHGDGRTVHLLEPVFEHRAVNFVEQSLIDPDHEARGDPQEVPVEGCVVNLAQGHSIGYDGVATYLAVTDDVGGVEQFDVSKSAHGATRPVGVKDSLSKQGLMKTLLGHSRGVHLLGCVQRREDESNVRAREAQDGFLVSCILPGM